MNKNDVKTSLLALLAFNYTGQYQNSPCKNNSFYRQI